MAKDILTEEQKLGDYQVIETFYKHHQLLLQLEDNQQVIMETLEKMIEGINFINLLVLKHMTDHKEASRYDIKLIREQIDVMQGNLTYLNEKVQAMNKPKIQKDRL